MGGVSTIRRNTTACCHNTPIEMCIKKKAYFADISKQQQTGASRTKICAINRLEKQLETEYLNIKSATADIFLNIFPWQDGCPTRQKINK